MRVSIPIAALALLESASAMNLAQVRKFMDMAEAGFNPDGTPMEDAATPQIMANIMSTESASSAEPPPPPADETIVPEYVQLPIDNFARNQNFAEQGTFYNRFWVREGAYKPGGPVFIYDAGEANAEPNALFRLQNDTSFFKQIVDMFNGIGIVWEHRFYGNSTPSPIDVNTPPEAFQFLTTEQSLADVDRFAKQFSRPNINYTLTPDNTPWVFVGGSYPGMRAAFIRDKYPDTIFASYASSAPTEARIDMSVYFDPVYRGMNAYGFGNCTKDIQAAVRYMDQVMADPKKSAALKEKFLGLGAGNNSNPTFADALTTPFYQWQSYGVEGGVYGLRAFCNWIETDPKTNKTAPAEGWARPKGASFTVDRWASYPAFVTMVNMYMNTECSGKQNVTGDCNLDLKFTDPASIAWTWQYCTQWGYFQSANLGPNQLVSKYNSLVHQRDICHRQFPTAPRSLLPEWPNTDRTNRIFGGWDLRPSQVYWSGGEFDPWRTLSPLTSEPWAPDAREFIQPVPRCGQGQNEDSIFGYVMKGAQHCYDFRTTFAGGAVSRKYFTDALAKWLKCFRPKKRPGYGHRWRA